MFMEELLRGIFYRCFIKTFIVIFWKVFRFGLRHIRGAKRKGGPPFSLSVLSVTDQCSCFVNRSRVFSVNTALAQVCSSPAPALKSLHWQSASCLSSPSRLPPFSLSQNISSPWLCLSRANTKRRRGRGPLGTLGGAHLGGDHRKGLLLDSLIKQ